MEKLFEKWANEPIAEKNEISAHGSARRYFRLKGRSHVCIAAINDDVRENEAFFYYSDFFRKKGLKVPEVYAVSADSKTYLQQDLGNQTLYDLLVAKRTCGQGFDKDAEQLYHEVIDGLVAMQACGKEMDFSRAYPREAFDRQSMLWDLNYFKYDFLKLAHVPFDEQLLENDFQRFADELEACGLSHFLYRDFQSRNMMLCDGEIYFIDYQGGRKGAPYYDLASLLYDAKAEIPDNARERLADYYYHASGLDKRQSRDEFLSALRKFTLLRIMQAMGAYGYRGLYEGKEHFVKSIKPALVNVSNILGHSVLLDGYPELSRVLQSLQQSQELMDIVAEHSAPVLTVTVNSFSYKRGLPYDKSGNGGGFVFDCRALPNPGRYPQYQTFTGKDQPVIEFLQREPEVDEFVQNAAKMVLKSVERYQQRGFANLQVNFGCTGGQHRSVYCAEQTARIIAQKAGCKVVVHHLEQEK